MRKGSQLGCCLGSCFFFKLCRGNDMMSLKESKHLWSLLSSRRIDQNITKVSRCPITRWERATGHQRKFSSHW
jgi:hypothetical protein